MTLKEAKSIFYRHFSKIEYTITHTWDFEWGVVFAWDSKFADIVGNSPVLIDMHSRELIPFYKLRTPKTVESMDLVLERYREEKGYPFAIKHDLPEKFDQLNTAKQVLALIETGEHYHIRNAIELLNCDEKLDLDSICNILQVNPKKDVVEELAVNRCYLTGGEYIIQNTPLQKLSPVITLLKEGITSIFAMSSLLEELPNEITQLAHLECITITECPLRKMPFDLRSLTKLQEIELCNTHFKEEQQGLFILPEGCKLKITGKYQDWMFDSRF